MDTSAVFEKLCQLANASILATQQYRSSGQLQLVKEGRWRYEYQDVKFGELGLALRYQSEIVYNDVWDFKNMLQFIEQGIKTLPDYSECIDTISRSLNVEDLRAQSAVEQFVRRNVESAFKESMPLKPEELSRIIIADLLDEPTEWRIVTWLSGIWLQDDAKYQLGNSATLRRPNQTDLPTYLPINILRDDVLGRLTRTTAVLEFNTEATFPGEAQEIEERYLNILILFRVASIKAVQSSIRPKALIRMAGTQFTNDITSPVFRYQIGYDDIPKLRKLIRKLFPFMPTNIRTLVKEPTPLELSIQRYKDGLSRPGGPDSRIASAITCLESLLLKSNELDELSHRLSQRTSMLLRQFSFNSLDVFRDVKKAYTIRSKFSHGQSIRTDKMPEAQILCDRLMNYVRVVILVSMQTSGESDKDGLIQLLDGAMLDNKELRALRSLIKNSHVFIA